MTGREFFEVIKMGLDIKIPKPETERVLCEGVHELAGHLCCSESKIYALRRDGILDEAVVSRIGRSIVFDVEKARRLAQGGEESYFNECNTKKENNAQKQ